MINRIIDSFVFSVIRSIAAYVDIDGLDKKKYRLPPQGNLKLIQYTPSKRR
jgi:hypothetical protein